MIKKISFCILVLMCATLLFGFALTTLTSIALVNSTVDSTPIGATTPSTGVVTTLQVNTSVLHGGTGLQHVRTASCTTAAALNASCTTTVNWPSTWADTNYTASCSPDGTTGGGVAISSFSSKAAASVVVGIVNVGGSSTASSTTLDCIGMHD